MKTLNNQNNKAFEKWRYQDPARVFEREENKTCCGCKNVSIAFNTVYCSIGKCYGKRCKNYSEIETTS